METLETLDALKTHFNYLRHTYAKWLNYKYEWLLWKPIKPISTILDSLMQSGSSISDLYMFSLQYGLKSIQYHAAKLWNTFPLELRNAPMKITFKTKLKIQILNKVDN